MSTEHTHEDGQSYHEQPDMELSVQTMYGLNTRQALVQLTIGETTLVIPTTKAREIGRMLLDVAAASEADGFLYEFVTGAKNGAPPEVGARIVQEFRTWREHGNSFPEEQPSEEHEAEEPSPN